MNPVANRQALQQEAKKEAKSRKEGEADQAILDFLGQLGKPQTKEAVKQAVGWGYDRLNKAVARLLVRKAVEVV